jgi:hypothetical protein
MVGDFTVYLSFLATFTREDAQAVQQGNVDLTNETESGKTTT